MRPPARRSSSAAAGGPRSPAAIARCGLAGAIALAACTPSYDPCFTPDSVVESFRVLAVRADPPEALVELDAGQVPTGYGGTRVQLEVAVTASGARGDEVASATKTLLFSDARTTPQPNAPIDLAQVDVTLDAGLFESVPQGEVAPMLVGHGYGLRPRLEILPDGGSPLEMYNIVDLSGAEVTLREQVSYQFYAENNVLFGALPIDNGTPIGVFIDGANLADEPQPGQPDPPDGLVRATPMLASEPRVWVVARDSRGATAWSWFDVRISDARICSDPNGNPCPPGKSCCADPFIGCQ